MSTYACGRVIMGIIGFAILALVDAAVGAMGQAFVFVLMGTLFACWLVWSKL